MAWNLPRIFGQKKKVDITKESKRYREETNKDHKHNNSVVDITKESERYRKEAKKGQKYNNSVADILASNRSSKHTPGTSQRGAQTIENLTERFEDLLERAEIMEIEDKYSKKSIDALKEQVDKVKTARKELSRSLTELSSLPSNIVELAQKRASLGEKVDKLRQENRHLNKPEILNRLKVERGISKDAVNRKIALNNKEIISIKNQISEIGNELKSLGSEEKVEKLRELSDNIKNNLTEFKKEVSKLETKIKSIGKGPAPKPPAQTPRPVRPAPPPPGTTAQKLGEALKEFEARKNLRTLVKYIESDGVYEGSKEYLLKVVDVLKDDFKLIDNNKSEQIKETLNNSNLTKEEFVQITNALINTIDSDLKSRIAKEQPVVGNKTQELQDERSGNKTEQVTSL